MPRVAAAYADLKQSVDSTTWDGVLQGLQEIVTAGEPRGPGS